MAKSFGRSMTSISDGDSNFQNSDNCNICKTKFNVVKNRRHHCRFCMLSVCNSHSLRRYPVNKNSLSDLVRICDNCYHQAISEEILNEIDIEISRK
jgi:hypothetical protein